MDFFRIYNQKKNLVEQMNRSGSERVTLIAESLTNLLVAHDYGNMESLRNALLNWKTWSRSIF